MTTHQQQVRTWSMLCHLSALAGLIIPFGSILGPLIVGALLFGTMGYGAFVGSPFALFAGGFGLGSILSLIRLVSWILVVLASVRANNGELFHYPSIKFIR